MPDNRIYDSEYMDYEEACAWYQKQVALEEAEKPKHEVPTNWEHCCRCCPQLEKELKKEREEKQLLKDLVRKMRKEGK